MSTKSKFLGKVGVWLCNRYSPRPCTSLEIATSLQHAGLVVDVLRGNVPDYGRDRDDGFEPIVSERKVYAKLAGTDV